MAITVRAAAASDESRLAPCPLVGRQPARGEPRRLEGRRHRVGGPAGAQQTALDASLVQFWRA
jgi:hypothetical protein